MFSFTGEDADGENTPFFEDNHEQPSLFSSQQAEQPSAFDLFNSRAANHYNHNFSSYHQSNNDRDANGYKKEYEKPGNCAEGRDHEVDRGRQSKKSIIMELDEQFDRREAVKNLEELYNSQQQDQQYRYPNLVESQVKHFQSGQKLFNQNSQLFSNKFSTSIVKDNPKSITPKLQFNFNKRQLKTNNNVQELQKEQKKANIFTNYNLKNAKQQSLSKPNTIKQQKIQQNDYTQDSKLDRLNFEQQFSFNQKLPNPQPQIKQEKTTLENRPQAQHKNQPSLSSSSILNKLKTKENALLQQSSFNPIQKQTEQETKPAFGSNFSFAALRGSRAQNVGQKINGSQSNSNSSIKIINQKTNTPERLQFGNFNTTFKKNTSRDSQLLSRKQKINQSVVVENNNSNKTKEHIVEESKRVEQKKFSFPTNNLAQISQNKPEKQTNSTLLTNKFSSLKSQAALQQNTTKLKQGEDQEKAKEKQKQKPRFNFRSIKQPKNEKQKAMQQHVHAIVKQQITKRQQNTTAKLLKNITFGKGLSFGNFSNQTNPKEQQLIQTFQQKSKQTAMRQLTPKITKIQSKSLKAINIRETEKIKCYQQQIQKTAENKIPENSEQFTEQLGFGTHRIDFDKYENEMFELADQIEQTKKKYSACDNGYKKIFILVNQANMMLSQKFMSQTQKSTQKHRRQDKQKDGKQWKESQIRQ